MTTYDDSLTKCPIDQSPLYLMHDLATDLYMFDPPWPGAGTFDPSPSGASSYTWRIECVEGHVVWTHRDQIRIANDQLDDPDDGTDLDTEFPPPFDRRFLPPMFPMVANPVTP